jgi:hypothetical protein
MDRKESEELLQPIPNEKFRKIDSFIKQLIDDKKIPGALLLLSKNDELEFLQKYGWHDVENSIPLEYDAIFRISPEKSKKKKLEFRAYLTKVYTMK